MKGCIILAIFVIHGLSAGVFRQISQTTSRCCLFTRSVLNVEVKGSVANFTVIQAQVGAKKLNEMRVNLRRGVVNNIIIVKTKGYGGLEGILIYQEIWGLTGVT